MGSEEGTRPRLANRVRVEMEESLKGAPGKLCMRRISIRQEGDKLLGSTRTHQGSGNIHSMVAHNGLSLLLRTRIVKRATLSTLSGFSRH